MKRFLLFAGDCAYPEGGWKDFRGSYDTFVEAESAGMCDYGGNSQWWHVIDSYDCVIVAYR